MKISTSTLNFSFSYIFYWQINISLPFWWDFLYSVFVNRNFWPGTIYYVCKLFGKSNILTPWYAHLLCGASKGFLKAYKVFIKPFEAPQRCAYQAVRNVRFSKKLASALNEWFSRKAWCQKERDFCWTIFLKDHQSTCRFWICYKAYLPKFLKITLWWEFISKSDFILMAFQ